MIVRMVLGLAFAMLLAAMSLPLLAAPSAQAPRCLPDAAESADQAARRAAAIRFLQQVNTAQARLRSEHGILGSLQALQDLDNPPVGFVPKLLVDQWNYLVSLKDVFDACEFTVFSGDDA